MLSIGRKIKNAIWSGQSDSNMDINHDYSLVKPGEEKPNFEFIDHPLKPTALWGNSNGIKPTNKWFQNLVIGEGKLPICLYPYQIKVTDNGLIICNPTLVSTKNYVISPFVDNLNFKFTSSLCQRKLLSYDDFCASMEWNDQRGSSIIARFARGCPYLTFELQNAALKFETIHAILSIETQGSTTTITFNNGQVWALFTSSNVSWAHTLNSITGNEGSQSYTGLLRIAIVAQPIRENLSILNRFSSTYPISAQVDFEFPNDLESFMHFKYEKKGGDLPLLMFCLPHHKDSIINPSNIQLTGYRTIKGELTAIVGDQWTLFERLNNIQWFSPNSIDQSLYSQLIAASQKDFNLEIDEKVKDPYFFGKSLAKIARLALIFEQTNQVDLIPKVLTKIKKYVEPWLSGNNEDRFVYDKTWGGIVTINGINDQQADFGNGYYNDHHFHYGYFLYVCAIIGKYDPGWITWWRNPIQALMRDFANTKDDGYFLKFRVKDFYDGHSWASGLYEFGDSKNQESTSESVNAYYSLYLLALAMKNTELSNIYNLLLTTELRSCKKYWHMTSQTNVYHNDFNCNKTVGILWTSKVDYATWFGANAEFIHCIQMLPFLPISHALLERSWIQEAYPILESSLTRLDPPISGGWRTFVLMAKAIIDKDGAINAFFNSSKEMDDGNTLSNTLYWLSTQ